MTKAKNVQKTKNIDQKEIIELVKNTVANCYGIVSFAKKNEIDNFVNQMNLQKGKKEEAIFIKKGTNGSFTIDIFVIVNGELKITETISETQKVLSFTLKHKYGAIIKAINVYAEKIASN